MPKGQQDGGYAFLSDDGPGHGGLTMREYFASQERSEPPAWFKHQPAPGQPTRPDPADYFKAGSEEYTTARDWMRDPCYDLGAGFKKFAESVHRYYADREAWQSANNLTRLVQWRFVVAEAMVERAFK